MSKRVIVFENKEFPKNKINIDKFTGFFDKFPGQKLTSFIEIINGSSRISRIRTVAGKTRFRQNGMLRYFVLDDREIGW